MSMATRTFDLSVACREIARHISATCAPYLQQNFTALQCVGDSGLDLVERIDCRNRYSDFVGRDHLRCRSDGLWELLCKSRGADREAPNGQIVEDHVEGTDRQRRKAGSRIAHEYATLPEEPGEPPARIAADSVERQAWSEVAQRLGHSARRNVVGEQGQIAIGGVD